MHYRNLQPSALRSSFTDILCKVFLLVSPLLTGLAAKADERDQLTASAKISYTRQIEPIFRAHCQGCHQPAKSQGELDMTRFEQMLSAGESGETAIVPGSPADSYLIEQIVSHDGSAAMPKDAPPLDEASIKLITEWIEQGAINDTEEAGPKYSSDHPPEYHRAPVITSLDFSADGAWLAVTGFHEVLLAPTDSSGSAKRLVGLSDRIESVDFSPDSRLLAVTGGSPGRFGEVQIWEVATGELLLSQQFGFDTIQGGQFSPDGKLIAFGCSDNTVRAINVETGKQVLHQGAHEDWLRACVFTPDSKHIVSAGRDMTVKLTEVATERFIDNITSITPGALRGGINALAMHPEREELLVGGADGSPKVYRIFRQTQRRIGDDANLVRKFPPLPGRIFSVAIAPSGKFLAATATLDGSSWLRIYAYDFDGTLPDDVKDAMAKRLSERSAEDKKRISDYTSNTPSPLVDVELPESSLYAAAFSHDSRYLAVGGSDGVVRVIDVATGEIVDQQTPFPIAPEEIARATEQTELLLSAGRPLAGNDIPDPAQEAAHLPQGQVQELRVSPERIELTTADQYVQMVVTAVYASGNTADVTRLCSFDDVDSLLSVSPSGDVRRVRTGTGNLRVKFAGQSQLVEVELAPLSQQQTPDFIRDVNPILSRLGCNAGTCHGAQKGRAGFKLSLRGYDPLEDVRALSDDLSARRMNTAMPDASLMLLKPLGSIPHEGGVLLDRSSSYHQTLRDWIAAGAPLNTQTPKVASIQVLPSSPVIQHEGAWQQFRVVATYPDGSRRDVTKEAFLESGNSEICTSHAGGRVKAIRRGEAPVLVRYEGAYTAATVTVMGDRDGFVWREHPAPTKIDQLVAAKWQRMKIEPSSLCNDHEYLRRVRLDLTGLPPTAQELRSFLDDPRPSVVKRRAKVEELIGSGDYVDHWANKWADLLQVNSKFIGKEGAQAFRGWIRDCVAENKPYDQFARQILTASGSNKKNPAASYYKILREPDLMMENTTHLFLAVRFNCNKCHDHPFERWTQDQYYELAAFFAQTGLKKAPESGNNKIGGTAVSGATPLYEEVYDKAEGEMSHIRTGDPVEPSFPYECDFECSEGATRRERLAAWITSPDNPYFARSFVNRVWGYLTGQGLMTPLDDIRAGNPPTNPELLEHLTEEFIDSGFDVRHMHRLICNSRTYQLSVATNQWNEDDSTNYSHALARRLPAEVLYDAVHHVTGAVSKIPGVEPGTRAAELPDVAFQLPDGFLSNLGRPVRESACECERSDGLQLGPVMALVSGPTVGTAISDPECALPDIAAQERNQREMIREIYMRVLSRPPQADEVDAIVDSADQIELDHQRLKSALDAKEEWWTNEKKRLEEDRVAQLAETKQAIVDRTAAIADERAKAEMQRLEKVAQAEQELSEYAAGGVELANKYLSERADSKDAPPNNWFPLSPTKLSSSNKDQLIPQPDRSIIASGDGGKTVYEIKYRTSLRQLTGLRLECLTIADQPGHGPGIASNGNFVITELEVHAAPANDPSAVKKLDIQSGVADFTQGGFAIEQTFDGQVGNQRGWAVSPRGGVIHWATFKFRETVDWDEPLELTVKVHQNHNAQQHRLARFRISATTDNAEIGLGLPEEFIALAATATKDRTETQMQPLLSYLAKSDKQWTQLQEKLASAKKKLPEDPQLVALRARQKMLEVETPDDAKLLTLRRDFAASQRQIADRRLTLAQDLTWALINSPAFLFNH